MSQTKSALAPCYWAGTGKYQEQFQSLYDKLVPIQGEADTIQGEAIRAISRWQHDYFNNLLCNAVDAKMGDAEDDEWEWNSSVFRKFQQYNPYYYKMWNTLEEYMGETYISMMNNLMHWMIKDFENDTFSKETETLMHEVITDLYLRLVKDPNLKIR